MHDCFDILGVAKDAPAPEIRRAWARRGSRTHPDFSREEPGLDGAGLAGAIRPAALDAAVDFVDLADVIDRMRRRFFGAA